MTLKEFLKKVRGREESIVEYSEIKALEAVKQNGYALQYVKEQSEAVCLEAVKQTGDALRYVDKRIFKITKKVKIKT